MEEESGGGGGEWGPGRPPPVSKETYYSVKRDLLQCQKRPTTVGGGPGRPRRCGKEIGTGLGAWCRRWR
jgi:hypothetical protein